MRSKKSLFYLLILTMFLTFNLISCGGGGGGSVAPAADPLIVFVTSASGTGNLSTWADAGGQTGLAAGDAICQARADVAGLPGTYRAWLSSSATDAYCHIQGYDGTKIVSNCGQGTLPVAAGPWVQTNGHPFAGTIDKLINDGEIYAPVRYDENGDPVTGNYYTGTNSDGSASLTCSNWTVGTAPSETKRGSEMGTTGWWTDTGGITCDGPIRLLCFQTGTGGPLHALTVPAGAKRVFVTSTTHNGNLGGRSGANTICQQRAQAAGLANYTNYKAWISDTTNAIANINSAGPWYRPDGVKVADTKIDLTDGSIFTAISQTETGIYVDTQYHLVWTGTGDNGAGFAENCSNWSDASSATYGRVGYATLLNGGWTYVTTSTCNNLRALYCFED